MRECARVCVCVRGREREKERERERERACVISWDRDPSIERSREIIVA